VKRIAKNLNGSQLRIHLYEVCDGRHIFPMTRLIL
jgi:hypothetical protein